MAYYRQIYQTFWTDTKVDDEFTPEDKYFYLYLLTNPHTNLCGCYEISVKQMVRETGYNDDTILRLLKRFEKEHRIISYCADTSEILLLNWSKYNWSKSADTLKGVAKEAQYIKFETFKKEVFCMIECKKNDTPYRGSIDPLYTSVSVSVFKETKNQDKSDIEVEEYDTGEEKGVVGGKGEEPSKKKKTKSEAAKETNLTTFKELAGDYGFLEPQREVIQNWLLYKAERGDAYKEQGMKSLLTVFKKNFEKYGTERVNDAVEYSSSNMYAGIVWDILERKEAKPGGTGRTRTSAEEADARWHLNYDAG